MTQPPQNGEDTEDKQQPTLLEQMGGISGLVYSSVPVLVFVLVNSIVSLQAAIWSSVGSAVLITILRILRKQPLQPAISGFFGVAIAAFIAYRTGSAKGFFLFGIWASLVYGGVFLASVVVRWPLVGVIWTFVNGYEMNWRSDKRALHAYDLATLAAAVIFFGRFIVQRWLYDNDQTGWLAFAKIAMGYPLTALALVVTVWAVARAGHRQRDLQQAREAKQESDAEIEARLRAKYSEPATES
jgi:Protein of unknown function (DUF3159)